MHFSTIGGEKFLRAQYASSASMGGHAAPHPTGVAVHEMGHVVSMHSSADITSTNLITARATAAGMGQDDQHVSAYVGHQISIYGGDSPPEAMAEAFADVLVNGSSARPLSKDIHTIIDAYYQSVNLP